MSFGTNLKNEFDRLCGLLTGGVNEQILFNQLVNAFNNVGGNGNVEIIHGTRWCVEFDNTGTKDFYWPGAKTNRCELGDLLFVIIDGDKVRLSVMQNKFDKRMVSYDSSFTAQMNQLYLLKERPEFRYGATTVSMLKKAKLPSIGNYGTFRNNMYPYEMGYYSADCLLHRKACARARSQCKIQLNPNKPKQSKINGYDQENYCENIVDFGDSLVKMKIGEPYNLYEAVSLLNNINIVNVLQEWGIQLKYKENTDRPSIAARNIILLNAKYCRRNQEEYK